MAKLKQFQFPGSSTIYDVSLGSLNDVDDVNITSPSDKQIPKYNASVSKWENKDLYVVIIGTLEEGETELTFTNNAITSTARFEVYTEDCYIPLLNMERTNTSLTLTFDEQDSDVRVKLVISED